MSEQSNEKVTASDLSSAFAWWRAVAHLPIKAARCEARVEPLRVRKNFLSRASAGTMKEQHFVRAVFPRQLFIAIAGVVSPEATMLYALHRREPHRHRASRHRQHKPLVAIQRDVSKRALAPPFPVTVRRRLSPLRRELHSQKSFLMASEYAFARPF